LVERIREAFKIVPDLERMLARIHSEAIVSRDHVSFDPDVNKKKIALLLDTIDGLEQAHRIIGMVGEAIEGDMQSELIKKIYQDSPDIESVIETFKGMFDREEARSTGFIVPADGANEQYDDAKKEKEDCEKKLGEYLENAVKILKISKSKVVYKHMQKNLYQIEVPAATQVPDSWKIKTQTKAVRRYYPNDLLPLIEKSAKAEEKRQAVLRGELRRVYKLFDNYYHDWKKVITQIANLDCMISLSLVGRKSGLEMCKPEFITNAVCLDIEEMVHPCITPADGHFIPNDTKLGVIRNSNGQLENKPRLAVVTGANMGGKSTLLRQNCVAVILAQLGCKVPARSFRLSPVDRIFTRIGANDRIMSGESTFMVELNETSNILRNATCNSLIILDELGRGTSTFDGYGIAYAVTRFLAEETQCRTLFATHYFHLTEELKGNPNVSLYQMLVNATDKVTFLYKFVEGVSPQSYGISVAEKAGIPEDITGNATSVSKNFEELLQISDSSDLPGAANVLTDTQRELFAVLYNGLCDGNVDWDSLQERLGALYRIF
jgi:DNA mismatch repair protein MSH6